MNGLLTPVGGHFSHRQQVHVGVALRFQALVRKETESVFFLVHSTALTSNSNMHTGRGGAVYDYNQNTNV